MKKITFLLAAVFAVMFVNAQTNLVVNGSFEDGFTDGKPAPWYVVSSSVTGVTLSENTAIFAEGLKSLKVDAVSSSGTYSISQSVNITAGKKYTLSLKYFVESGDGTDVRLWANFKKDATTFFSDAELTSSGLYATLRSGNTSSSGSSYLPDAKGSWQTHSIEFTAPAEAVAFDFQFRTYKTAVVYWDSMSLVESTSANVEYTKVDKFGFFKSGKHLLSFQISNGTPVEVFNMVGEKVISTEYNGGIAVGHLNKGVYIVRTDKGTQKVTL